MGMDLSYLEQLMGGASDAGSGAGGVWVVSPDGALDESILRVVGKARSVADALGGYVYVLAGCGARGGEPQQAIGAGADTVLIADGVPGIDELAAFLRERQPQVVLFPRTRVGRALGGGIAHALAGGLCTWAADVAVDPVYQRVVAHQPVLGDAARQVLSMIATPAVIVVDPGPLPPVFNEPWRTGSVEDTGIAWPEPAPFVAADLPELPLSLRNAPVIVAAGPGLGDEQGFALAQQLSDVLGGVVAGDLGALDAGWIAEEQLIGLTGRTVAPPLYLALGIEGDTNHLMAITNASCIVAVQEDANAPIVAVADYNVVANPVEFARALLEQLGKQ